MKTVLALTLLAALVATVPVIAQTTPAAPPAAWSQNMDKQMQAMREMHDKMLAARTPEDRQKLMAEHMTLMQGGMSMMGGMGPGSTGMGMGMGMGPGSAGMGMQPGAAPKAQSAMPMAGADLAARMQMMEKRMEMMQTMMQMMMDRTTAPATK